MKINIELEVNTPPTRQTENKDYKVPRIFKADRRRLHTPWNGVQFDCQDQGIGVRR